jgi:hypothetical protein
MEVKMFGDVFKGKGVTEANLSIIVKGSSLNESDKGKTHQKVNDDDDYLQADTTVINLPMRRGKPRYAWR